MGVGEENFLRNLNFGKSTLAGSNLGRSDPAANALVTRPSCVNFFLLLRGNGVYERMLDPEYEATASLVGALCRQT